MNIRSATAADIPAIISLVNSAFAIETFLEGTRTDEQRISEMADIGEFLVGEDDTGRIVASVYVELRGDRGYMGMLAVDPSFQRGGLGREMSLAAEEHFRHHRCHYLDIVVLSLRPDLPPLYRKLGFTEVGREDFKPSRTLKPGYECYGIIMTKSL